MFYLTNIEKNIKLGFDFINKLPDDFEAAKSKSEKWVPFVMSLETPETTIAITEKNKAYMTVFEVEKIYNGIKNLLENTWRNEDTLFTHYSYESFFEISIEYLSVDESFEVIIWFILAECPHSKLEGFHIGYRFMADKKEMERFLAEFCNRFKKVCPQYPLEKYDLHDSLIEKVNYFPDDKRVVMQIQMCNWRQRNYRDSDPEMLSLYMIFEGVEKYELSLENYTFCGDEIMDVIEMDDHTMKIFFLADGRVETIVIKAQKEPCYYNIE